MGRGLVSWNWPGDDLLFPLSDTAIVSLSGKNHFPAEKRHKILRMEAGGGFNQFELRRLTTRGRQRVMKLELDPMRPGRGRLSTHSK